MKISKFENETLNTSNNLYIGHVYEVENDSEKHIIKFFISVGEGFNADYDHNIEKKEQEKINDLFRLNNLNQEHIYVYIYKYSDFFMIDPSTL